MCVTTSDRDGARVKVAESAGQHESTGNVSRELDVGVTAASVWMREGGGERERERTQGWPEYEGTHIRICIYTCMLARTIVWKVRAYVWRSSYYTPLMHRVRVALRARARRDESSIRLNARQPGGGCSKSGLST